MTLAQRIAAEIGERGPLSFAEFMERALYDPGEGYYSRPGRIGPRGDYHTASDVGPAFGRAVARQVAEIGRALGGEWFDIIEFAAGRGLLARDVLDALREIDRDLASRARYTLVDRSAAMREESRQRVPEGHVLEPDRLGRGHRGVVLAVELFDALPVHRVRRRGGRLVEIGVGLGPGDGLVEIERECAPGVRALAERHGAAAEEGSEAEVAPLAARALAAIERCLERGVVLIVDYGERAAELYSARRRAGTLLAYHAHTTNRDYLARVGEQDLTAHVNFSALEDEARRLGLTVLGLTTQDRFLIGNGVLEPFTEDGPLHDPRRVKARLQALALIHPDGMGRRFKVLALAKGPSCTLAGLGDPFAR